VDLKVEAGIGEVLAPAVELVKCATAERPDVS